MPQLEFETHLESEDEALFIRVPAEVVAALGKGKRVPVRVTLNGHPYESTIAVYGGRFFLPVRRQVREAAGVKAGDRLRVGLEYDAELRTVDLPPLLEAALTADGRAAAGFERLSYTHKKEVVRWLTDAKRPQTQERRLAQTMAMLRRQSSKTR
jgi:uncharacterized protein DUF1905/bacteriocin resistance YdeI/OmpD-like protein